MDESSERTRMWNAHWYGRGNGDNIKTTITTMTTMSNKAIIRNFTPIGKIYTDGAQELHINAHELSCEQLNRIIVRCADILRARAEIK